MKNKTLIILIMIAAITGCRRGNDAVRKTDSREIQTAVEFAKRPVLSGRSNDDIISIKIDYPGTDNEPVSVTGFRFRFLKGSNINDLEKVAIYNRGTGTGAEMNSLFGQVDAKGRRFAVTGKKELFPGINIFCMGFTAAKDADPSGRLFPGEISISLSDGSILKQVIPGGTGPIRFGSVLRESGQDGCDTYRIPGIITTNSGTLITVYDCRYDNSRDLQGNIDIGMIRSIDGGRSWERQKVIMDMGSYMGKPEDQNGIGDPSILVDRSNNRIWVCALWMYGFPGQAAWNASMPGIEKELTGQMMMVFSDDDGLTWSDPVNITPQVKDPSWRLMLQGPGRGLTLSDGTLVFPAQYRDESGVPWSTIIYSRDHGTTWECAKGVKPNTTEAQCVQLSDGTIMINMRDNRNSTEKGLNNGRAVAVTGDTGKTWITHSSSNSALPEPLCMASLISADLYYKGKPGRVLFFSNPDNRYERADMTIKASLDEGITWPSGYQVHLNSDNGYGYSCLTLIGENNIGIVYEGEGELYFQVVPAGEIIPGLD